MLITLILDYAGGTYVSQLAVRDLAELKSKLLEAIDWSAVRPQPSASELREFEDFIADNRAVELTGLTQVWCVSGPLGESSATIHAINTAIVANQPSLQAARVEPANDDGSHE